MSKTSIWVWTVVIIIIIVGVIYWIWAANNSMNSSTTLNSGQAQNTVQLASTSSLGSFLTDSKGRTLYYFANDAANQSNCTGTCLTIWLPFYAPTISVPTNLNSTDFNQITTAAGTNQTTYKGWPLYYYSGDVNSGDTKGQGIQNLWFVAPNPFYNVLIMNNSKSNSYLADVNGLAIYYNKTDTQGTSSADPKSTCTGNCLSTWSIFDQSQAVAPSLLKSADFKEFTRPDGQTQLSYKGWPLYQYSGDSTSGDAKGDGISKTWYLVKP